jgi:hypothetical protein
MLNPNMVTSIEVPLVIAAEVSGKIQRQIKGDQIGVGGIKVMLFNLAKDVVTEVTSFNDGDYFYLGLVPGTYRAYIEPKQLEQYGYRAEPEVIEFKVDAVEGGSIIEDINFLLIPSAEELTAPSENETTEE